MKIFILSIILFLSTNSNAQKDINQHQPFLLEGYDLVAYFDFRATKGKDIYRTEHNGYHLKFSTAVNFEKFKKNPDYYMPQFEGWCAYTISTTKKTEIANPELFEIRNGKLYLFCNESLELWLTQNPNALLHRANLNWEEMNLVE